MNQVAALVLLLLFLPGSAAPYQVVSQEHLSLRVWTERSDFLPGEPILLGLALRNNGTQPFEDPAPLDADQGYVGFSLRRDNEDPRQTHGWLELSGRSESPALQPGEQLCHVTNLGAYFRTAPRALLPGSYVLRTLVNARSGVRKDLHPVQIEGNEVAFTVLDTTSMPNSEVDAFQLTRRAERGERLPDRWKEIRAQFSGSRYYPWVVGVFGHSLDSTEVESTAMFLITRGRPLSAAAVLNQRLSSMSDGPDVCLAWIKRLEDVSGMRDLSCFLQTWERYVSLRVQRQHGDRPR